MAEKGLQRLGAELGHLGQLDEAREALDESMRRTLAHLRANHSPRLVERMLEGWQKAGWWPPGDKLGPVGATAWPT